MSQAKLNSWVKKLSTQNLPVLNTVVVEINKLSGSEEADANRLAEIILKDPNLTSHVLKVANSVQYNYSKVAINTVSRAVVLIGLKGMRAICISLLVLESLLKNKPKDRVMQLIAQGFHAATQARNLISRVDEQAEEEVFIAALLFNLGEMAFWTSEAVDEKNARLMSDDPAERKEAMDVILGTSFKAITRELAKSWSLGETLEQALYPPSSPSKKIQAIVTGERLSRAALYGWDSPQISKVLGEVARFSDISEEQALKLVKENSDKAAEVALSYGVSEACPLIPTSTRKAAVVDNKPESKVLKGDPHLQLNILRELASATSDRLDVNMIFQMVVEGMHRGIGLERVAIAFIQGRKLQAKYILGEGTTHWREAFNLDIGPYSENIFTLAIEKGGSHWFNQETIATSPHLYPDSMVTVLGKFPAFVSVMQIENRKIAAFYADRWTFGGKLNKELFESFKHFATQAQTSLNVLSQSRSKKSAK